MATFKLKDLKLPAQEHWEVPDFKGVSYMRKQHPYCVCVFVINEGKKIRAQLEAMKEFSSLVDIIIADGGSTDNSLETSFLKSCNVRTLLTKTGKGKLSAQMRMAFAFVLEEGYEGVVVVDGNHKDDITAIPRFVDELKAGVDHVQGSRFIPGGKAVNTPLSRLIGLKVLHAPLLSLASRRRYTDTTNGFRAYSSKLLADVRLKIFREVFSQYELHYYLAIKAARLGYSVKEIPVTRTYPHGKVPTKISPVKGNLKVLNQLFKAVLGRYNPR